MGRLSRLSGKAASLLPKKLRSSYGSTTETPERSEDDVSITSHQSAASTGDADSMRIAAVLDGNAAFQPEKLYEEPPATVDSVIDKTKHAMRTAAKAIRHPVDAAKHKAAKTMALQDTPYLSAEADRAFVNAHEELCQAEEAASDGSDAEDHLASMRLKMDAIEETRENLKVAWITSRFVQRVGVVRSMPYSLPDRRDPIYWTIDGCGKRAFRWDLYIAHHLRYNHQGYNTQYFPDIDEVPFDKDILSLHVETLIVVSGAWQAWLLHLRKLSRWEVPAESAKWFAAWVAIWIIDRVVTFILLWFIYIVVKHRWRPESQETYRKSYERVLDRSQSAFRFNELVSQHGEAKWLDPLLEKCGPTLQMQLSDTADHLEVLYNFYIWANPSATAASLAYLATVVLYGNVTDTNFVMRSITMLCIGYFFLCRPIASLHPRYRHMVTPLKWIFWNIPTNAELAFQHLQKKPKALREEPMGASSPYNKESSLRSFACTNRSRPGRLTVTTSHVRFKSSSTDKEGWRRAFRELDQMRKVDRKTTKSLAKLRSPWSLQLIFADGTVETLEGLKRRDEVFNLIIGFSDFMWKQLPSLPADDTDASISDNNAVNDGDSRLDTDAEDLDEWHDAPMS